MADASSGPRVRPLARSASATSRPTSSARRRASVPPPSPAGRRRRAAAGSPRRAQSAASVERRDDARSERLPPPNVSATLPRARRVKVGPSVSSPRDSARPRGPRGPPGRRAPRLADEAHALRRSRQLEPRAVQPPSRASHRLGKRRRDEPIQEARGAARGLRGRQRERNARAQVAHVFGPALALGIDPRRVLRVDLQRRLKICDDDDDGAWRNGVSRRSRFRRFWDGGALQRRRGNAFQKRFPKTKTCFASRVCFEKHGTPRRRARV